MKSKQNREGIKVSELLGLIPDEELAHLARDTRVDYCAKVLYGRSMFYLLLYGLLETQKTSLRSLEKIFNSKSFKHLFDLDVDKTVRHSSISERLGVMDVSFFERAFELFYTKLSTLYSEKELLLSKIVRVDSSMIAESSARLLRGMNIGRKKDGKKQIKYTIGFDGMLPCCATLFSDKEHLSEDKTIPRVVLSHARKSPLHKIYTFDRGVCKRTTFETMNKEGVEYVCRLKAASKYESIEVFDTTVRQIGTLEFFSDEKVYLYRNGRLLTEETFRLIQTRNQQGEEIWFLTNIFDLDVAVILLYYKKRWDIEVFFRFLKQELNLSHLLSTNENGIKIILYMTLILSMLIMIYKRLNNTGYKIGKLAFSLELNELIIKMIVLKCEGNPALFSGSG